jgi:hypothetical protein
MPKGIGIAPVLAAIAAYWVPSIVATVRRKNIPNFGGVIVVNFLLGWTLIGWIVALVMAVRSRPQPVVFAPRSYGLTLLRRPPQGFPQPTAPQPGQWQEPQHP